MSLTLYFGKNSSIYIPVPATFLANLDISLIKTQLTFPIFISSIISVKPGKMAVVEGLENFIIADSDDALLICKKGDENRLRQIFNDVNTKFKR